MPCGLDPQPPAPHDTIAAAGTTTALRHPSGRRRRIRTVRQRLEKMEPKLIQVAEDVDLIKLVSRKNADELQGLKLFWSTTFSRDIEALRLEIKLLRDDFKASQACLEAVEAKVPA